MGDSKIPTRKQKIAAQSREHEKKKSLIGMKYCTGRDTDEIIAGAIFDDFPLRGFGLTRSQISGFIALPCLQHFASV